jgi:hypothetical protein
MQPIIELERINYWARVWETPDGFLLSWGDYVANEWQEAHATLSDTLSALTGICLDDQGAPCEL